MVWLSGRSRYIPYVVEVDKLGYALTLPQPLSSGESPDMTTRMERYEIATFIRNARSITTDPQVEHQMLDSLLAHARGAADRFLDSYHHSDDFAITRSRLPRSRRSPCRSIRFFDSRRAATRCAGPKCSTT